MREIISIRGLSPDFTTTLLNGRQQASSGDNRAVEFDQYPSELLASVVIYKTPDANIAGFGLSGTADLRTVRPLNFKKRTVAVNVRGEINGGGKLNDDVKNWGGRASISYIDKITPELGFAVGVAYLNSPSSNRHTKGYNYETFCCGRRQMISPVGAQDCDLPDRPGSLRLFAQQQAPRGDRHPRVGAERPRSTRSSTSIIRASSSARRCAARNGSQRLGRHRKPSPMSSRKTVAAPS